MLAALCMVALAQIAPAPAATPEFTVEPTADGIRLMSAANGYLVELAHLQIGPVVDTLRHGDALYAALAAGGVAVISLRTANAPTVVGHLAEGRSVQRLAHQGADILVLVFADRDTAAYALADPLLPIPAELASSSNAPPPTPHANVTAVHGSTVIIDGGSAAGFWEGQHIAIFARAIGEGLPERLAVIALDSVSSEHAEGQLGKGDRVHVGDTVQATTAEQTGSIFLPRANAFSWRLALALRPFFDSNAGSGAVGMLIDFTAGYYFESVPLRIEAGAQPLGVTLGANQAHNPLIAFADIAYSTPYFELGLGSGVSALASASTGNASVCTASALSGCAGALPATQSALIVETLRLGALDGLNLQWIAAAGVVPGQGFQILSARAEANVPVARRVTLFASGGGGLGYFYGEAGVRGYLNGVGGPGTVILSAGVGGAGIEDDAPEVVAGPALSLGVELRL